MPAPVSRAITRAQVRAVHAALGRLAIEDDDYRAMLRDSFGAGSCLDLTVSQANELLNRLNKGHRKPEKPPRRRQKIRNPATPPVDDSPVVTLVTPAQLSLLDEMRGEITWEATDGYQRWLTRSLGIRRVRTTTEASRVIQGLKGLKRHGHSKKETL